MLRQWSTSLVVALGALLLVSGPALAQVSARIMYRVDDALGATPLGTVALAIRDDALSALSPAEGDAVGLRVDANGALWVTVANSTMAVTQSGTWNITNVSGTVSLPTGAATEASLAKLTQIQGSSTSGQSGPLTLAATTTGAPTYTTGESHPLSLTTGGLLRVAVEAGGGSGGTASSYGAAFPAQGTAIGVKIGSNMEGPTGRAVGSANAVDMAIVDGSGNQITSFGGGTQYAVDTALGATPTGTLALAIRDDALSTLTPVEGDAIGLRVSSTGALWTRNVWLTPVGDSLVDDTNDAVRTSVVTVVTTQGKVQTSREWHFTTAQTDAALVTVGGGTVVRVSHLAFTCDNANTVNVGMRIGFAATTLPAASSAGAAGIVLSHSGVAPGSGIATSRSGAAEGASGEDLRITMSVPTTGSCRVVADYETI